MNDALVEHEGTKYRTITEGSTTILFPETEEVFYNPVQQFNRDMSIAAIKTWAKLSARNAKPSGHNRKDITSNVSKYRILEAFTASGLRSIRYAKELGSLVDVITANDLCKDALDSIRRNCEYNQVSADVVVPNLADACDVMYGHRAPGKRFHVVDIDPYGSAAPFIDAAVQSVEDGGLLLITCTDLAVLCGKYPESCFSKYGGVALKQEYCHEMALRLVLNTIQTSAARYKRHIIPLMSCSIDFYVRIFVRVMTSAEEVRKAAANASMVYQCANCPDMSISPLGRASLSEKGINKFHLGRLTSHSRCDQCSGPIHIGGPFWGAQIHDAEFVKEFLAHLAEPDCSQLYHTYDRMLGMVTMISEELPDVPLYYTLANCASAFRSNAPSFLKLNSAILNAGYKVSMSHCNPKSIKTNAPAEIFWDIFRCWAKECETDIEKLPEGSVGRLLLSKEVQHVADFTVHPDANPSSKKHHLVRFEDHKGKNWGPKARAKKRKLSDEVGN